MIRRSATLDIQQLPVALGNFMRGRQGVSVDGTIIHTMVGTIESANSRFNNQSQLVSAHYGVGPDRVVQWVGEADTAYHCGNWQYNLSRIGIEHEDWGNYNSPRPDSEYSKSAALVANIHLFYGIEINGVTVRRHSDVYPTACPDTLDVERIIKEAQELAANNNGDIATLLKSDANQIVTLSSVALDQIDTITDTNLRNSLGFEVAEIKRKMGAAESRYTQNQH